MCVCSDDLLERKRRKRTGLPKEEFVAKRRMWTNKVLSFFFTLSTCPRMGKHLIQKLSLSVFKPTIRRRRRHCQKQQPLFFGGSLIHLVLVHKVLYRSFQAEGHAAAFPVLTIPFTRSPGSFLFKLFLQPKRKFFSLSFFLSSPAMLSIELMNR